MNDVHIEKGLTNITISFIGGIDEIKSILLNILIHEQNNNLDQDLVKKLFQALMKLLTIDSRVIDEGALVSLKLSYFVERSWELKYESGKGSARVRHIPNKSNPLGIGVFHESVKIQRSQRSLN